jgi:23S rRNA (cytosine1962-C5)-methyltransferase
MIKEFKIITNNQFKFDRFKSGHLWIFSNEINKKDLPKINTFVEVYDKKEKFLCKGVYNPHSLIAVRILSKYQDEKINRDFFKQRIISSLELRKNLGIDIKFCRLVYGESDFLPGVIIDRYNDVFVVQFFSYAMEIFKEDIIGSIVEIFNPSTIVIRNDIHSRLLEGGSENKEIVYSKNQSKDKIFVTIKHLSAKFIVDVLNGQKTGFYYDQAENRKYVKTIVKNKKVLDLCCYTGSFSIIAKLSGAKEVVGVDSSKQAIEIAKQNAKLNNVQINFVDAEVEEFLKNNKEKFDVVIFDPPSYTRSKKDIINAKKKYIAMCRNIMRFLQEGGIFVFSVCSQHISYDDVKDIIFSSILKNGQKGFILYYGKQSLDHPIYVPMWKETEYLKFVSSKIT